jgi:prepilin-type N-terminal cleavage/methylation domain-containing protein
MFLNIKKLNNLRNKTASFTLVELLIVIAILAVLAAAVVIVLNPAELLAQARDSQRVTDMRTVKDAIDLFVIDNHAVPLGVDERVYISLPDTGSDCPNLTASLPALPVGWQYVCVPSADLRNTDGTGWIPINFGSVIGGTPIPYLPLDPVNDAATGRYYTFVTGGSYELTSLMEARKQNAASLNDGGSLTGVYQVGSHIGLTPPLRDSGMAGYWTFDEGSGTTAYDSSGMGNDGIWTGTSAHYTVGKVGSYAASFDGTSNYIDCGTDSSLDFNSQFSVSFWIKGPTPNTVYAGLFGKRGEGYGWGMQISNTGPATYIRIDTSAGTNQTSGGLTTLDDTWHHAVYIIDSGSKRYYLDGILTYTGAYNPGGGLSNPSQRLTVGGSFVGQMDDVRIFNRPLSAEEVKVIYDATK